MAIWVRFIVTYLGEIKEFSWLVGLIQYTCSSTGYFLLVFLMAVVAFTDSFNALDQKILINGSRHADFDGTAQELEETQVNELDITLLQNLNNWLNVWQMAFNASIGDFDHDNFFSHYGYIDWLIFFLSCLFLIILMLNLLISVIAEA